MKYTAFIVLFLTFLFQSSFAQVIGNVPLSNSINEAIENEHLHKKSYDSLIHTSIKPYRIDEIKNRDVVYNGITGQKLTYLGSAQNIFPVIYTMAGAGTSGKMNNILLGGLQLNKSFAIGKIKMHNLFLSLTFVGGQTQPLNYADSLIKYTGVVPGFGHAYKSASGYSFQNFSGYLSYSPNKIFNFQIGRDKHFWGDGYRSLFLSDYSNNYFFGKITTNVWRLKYVSLYSMNKDLTQSNGIKNNDLNKFGTFHYLSWNVCKRFNLGVFESIVWQGRDSVRNRGFDANYLNPVIFFRPTEYSLGSSDNAFLGLSFKWNMWKKNVMYGQVLLDEFLLKEVKARTGWWANKQAVQMGLKFYDAFKVKNLFVQGEINYVRPYTYSHGSVQQNYGNYNLPLAHPLGANFAEFVGIINYTHNKWRFEAEGMYAVYGLDSSSGSYGKNIFISYFKRLKDYGNYTTQGLRTSLMFASFNASYLILPSINLRAELGAIARIEENTKQTLNTATVFISLKTNLFNMYHDY